MSSISRFYTFGETATAGATLTFTVWRSRPIGTASVDYAVTDGTAVLNTDYVADDALTGTLSFADREIFKTVKLTTQGTPTENRTVNFAISSDSFTIIESTAVGVIQSGDVVYSTPNGTGDLSGSDTSNTLPFASVPALISSAGVGRSVLLLADQDYYPVWSSPAPFFVRNADGGTAANPQILGRYGAGANPRIRQSTVDAYNSSSLTFRFAGSNTDYDVSTVFRDLDWVADETATDSVQNFGIIQDATSLYMPKNIYFDRLNVYCVDAAPGWSGLSHNAFLVHQGGINTNVRCCTFADGRSNGIFSSPTGTFAVIDGFNLLGNSFTGCGNEDDIRDWGLYLAGDDLNVIGNYLDNNLQGCKLAGGTGQRWAENIVNSSRWNENYTPPTSDNAGPRTAFGWGGSVNKDFRDFIIEDNIIIGDGMNCGDAISFSDPVDQIVNYNGRVRNNLCIITGVGAWNAGMYVSHARQNFDVKIELNTFVYLPGNHYANDRTGVEQDQSFIGIYLREAPSMTIPWVQDTLQITSNHFYRMTGLNTARGIFGYVEEAQYIKTDYNCYNGFDTMAEISGDATYTTLADWQGASYGQDANSIDDFVPLISKLLDWPYYPDPNNTSLDTAGDPASDVSVDFLGVSRPDTPSIGCVETIRE